MKPKGLQAEEVKPAEVCGDSSTKQGGGPFNLEAMKKENTYCWECKGKPNYIYFNYHSGKILSVICQGCRDAFEATIESISRANCSDPDCEECGRKNE